MSACFRVQPVKRLRRWLLRRLLGTDFPWRVTTHDGFYTPCDDDWHCHEVRHKIRKELGL